MVADLNRDGRTQRADPGASCVKFTLPRAHGQIAGYRNSGGLLGGNPLAHPVERELVLKPEMDVADVEQDERFSHPVCRAD